MKQILTDQRASNSYVYWKMTSGNWKHRKSSKKVFWLCVSNMLLMNFDDPFINKRRVKRLVHLCMHVPSEALLLLGNFTFMFLLLLCSIPSCFCSKFRESYRPPAIQITVKDGSRISYVVHLMHNHFTFYFNDSWCVLFKYSLLNCFICRFMLIIVDYWYYCSIIVLYSDTGNVVQVFWSRKEVTIVITTPRQ